MAQWGGNLREAVWEGEYPPRPVRGKGSLYIKVSGLLLEHVPPSAYPQQATRNASSGDMLEHVLRGGESE
jgi:hypothetical protein